MGTMLTHGHYSCPKCNEFELRFGTMVGPSDVGLTMIEKRCSRCNEAKPATREFFGSTPSGGLRGYCRVCMNKASFKYEANNKDARRERDAKRAKAAGGSRRSFDAKIKDELYKKQSGHCACCFRPIISPERGEVDHVVPLERGGRDVKGNLLLAHAQCNKEKHNKTLHEHWEWRVKVGLDAENLGRKHGLVS
jgi:5-methylcytosine-specific restriction endonuclease McrA